MEICKGDKEKDKRCCIFKYNLKDTEYFSTTGEHEYAQNKSDSKIVKYCFHMFWSDACGKSEFNELCHITNWTKY